MGAKNLSELLRYFFSDYLRLWLEEIEPTVSPSTFYKYRLQVNNRICPWFDERSIKLVDLTAQDIEAFYRKKLFEEQVKAVTIHRYHSNIHKALRRAVQTGRLRQNPADNILMPQKQKYIGAYYTVEELRYLLEHVRGESIEVPVTLAVWLGVRRGEAIGRAGATLTLHAARSVCRVLSPPAAAAKPKAQMPFTTKRRKRPPDTVYLLCRANWQPIS